MDTGQPSSSSTNFKAESGLILKNEDLLYIILCKLPARSFASSACVCKTWHKVCNQILARPKISSAFSLRTTSRIAVNEVVDKVLSAPIRPHFAIATVGSGFHLNQTIKWLARSLGSQTPIIVSRAGGIMGRHAVTDQFQEVKFAHVDYDACIHEGSTGIVLTVGFVPGLKVDAIPLLKLKRGPPVAMIDQFVMDIRNYTTSFSKCASPVGIIMFGDEDSDLALVLENLDYAMSMETVIVGDERCQFVYRSGNPLRNFREDVEYGAVALTFASDKDKLKASGLRPARFSSMVFASSDVMDYQTIFDIGKIQFHLALSKGVTAIGPRHRVVSVRANNLDRVTWFTARREGNQQVLDGQQILDHINDQLGNDVEWPELYIGVTKRRKCSIGSEKPGLITSLAFHRVAEGDEQYLYAEGTGIRSGDYFRFYHPDTATALASCDNINTKFRNLKAEYSSKSCLRRRGITDGVGKEVLGGFIFSCCCRGEPFFVRCNVDSYPFIENFPDVPVAGIFCGGEIGRGSSSLMGQEGQESSARSIQHVFSTVYLLMSYTPVCREH